ncbi:glucose-6-phosphate isomerase [Aliidiomarina taiwanensis]|uniref:Glucose-6-phosphate isomerase n=1 Tax=Aliidiomarina taiwanensis TaxID=946228 RepID=A0A432WR06_9GAMM|nr:glucose-6-phosphate isomerase [Aliidiomarina taiwanensis]RUO36242.1 glucose-6-phosphate isomerase [Aliidiomarina taiwanensis]
MQRKESLPLQQVKLNGLIYDWSYQRLTPEQITALAEQRLPKNFAEQRTALMQGTYLNISENRTVNHVLSRAKHSPFRQGNNSPFVQIVNKLRSGNWLGATGKPITDIVNIGVGGSDLGPLMTSFALKEFASDTHTHKLTTHFVSSMDGGQLYAVLPKVNPETTAFIIASKSFTTQDTLANAKTAQLWAVEQLSGQGVSGQTWRQHHLIGVSSQPERMTAYGIPTAHQLIFGETIGGRYSMWTAIGLAIATSCGLEVFRRLQNGAIQMDQHFAEAPLTENIPMLMALCGVYNREVRGINNLAILPYDGRFRHLPSYLQQLDMESNGKQYTATGKALDTPTGPIIWGGFGPNGQHAFFQHLHQGYDDFAADFLVVLHRNAPRFSAKVQASLAEQQELSVANCLAHRKLITYGTDRYLKNVDISQYYRGEHPNSLLALVYLTPETFGAIIAAYEHKVFTQGLIWQLNSFDQPGVELGKKIANDALTAIQDKGGQFDSSTDSIIALTRHKLLKDS